MNFSMQELNQKIDLVLDALMHLGVPQFTKTGKTAAEDAKRGIFARDYGIRVWDWPQGVGLYGLEKLQDLLGDRRYDEFLEDWVRSNIEDGLPAPNVNTTAPFIVLESLARRTQNETYIAMCRQHAQWLMEGLPRTKEGGFQHVTTGFEGKQSLILNEQQLWVDTLFMAVLFLARAGKTWGEQAWTDEAVHQILLHIKYLYEKKTGLLYHGWSFLRNDNFAGVFWSRGNSWFTYGILELLETLGDSIEGGTRQFILDTFRAQVTALRDLQAESGLWHTILDDPESYEEVSGSAAFCAAVFKAVRLGILEESWLPMAEKALEGVVRNIGPDGIVQNVSTGTGMGYDAQHYRDIVIAPIGYGQSMTAFALLEAMHYQKVKTGEALG